MDSFYREFPWRGSKFNKLLFGAVAAVVAVSYLVFRPSPYTLSQEDNITQYVNHKTEYGREQNAVVEGQTLPDKRRTILQDNLFEKYILKSESLNTRKRSRSQLFQDVTLKLSIDNDIDSDSVKPITFLEDYKNPCWYEKVEASYAYANNSIVQSYVGHRKNTPFHRTLSVMVHKLKARSSIKHGFSWRLRCLPYFYVAGVSKCGTTDLASVLMSHPEIAPPLRKEPTYWNRIRYHVLQETIGLLHRYDSLVSWSVPRPFRHYVDFYDPVAENIRMNNKPDTASKSGFRYKVTGDFTPSYLYDFDGWFKMKANRGGSEPRKIIADIIHGLTPSAKIIIILRNPISRLYSEYLYFPTNTKKCQEEFERLVRRGIELLQDCFRVNSTRTCIYDHSVNSQVMPVRMRAGLYYLFLKDWLQVFPRSQLFVTRLEDYALNRTHVANKIANFLGLSTFRKSVNGRTIQNTSHNKQKKMGAMNQNMTEMIGAFYRPWNQKLAEMLGDERFLWDSKNG